MKLKSLLLGGAFAALGVVALAQPVITRVQSIGSSDLIQIIPNGAPTAQSVYAPSALFGTYSNTLAGGNPENWLIGGDSTTNLWQRATTGSSVTTTLTYGGPDRWAYWSGTGTAMTVSRTTTAADLPSTPSANFRSGFKMARTAAQTGVVQMCMMQALESANSYAFAGQTAEVDFHATAGATFSATSSLMKVYVITGTGSDEAASTAAFNLNAGGGGSSTWTGQVNTGVDVTISTTNQRYTVAIPVATGTTQVAVALCYTPVGTAGANDYIAFSGIQLTRNSALTTAAGTAGIALTNDTRAKSFSRRSQEVEAALQQRYFYKLTETAAIAPVAPCAAVDTTHTNCLVQFPTTMRIAPTGTFANGFASPTTTSQATLGACSTLSAAATVTSTVGAVNSFLVNCAATTIPAAGVASFLYSNNGTGTISLTSEL